MSIKKKLSRLMLASLGCVVFGSAAAVETFHVPGSACLLKRDTYSVRRDGSELIVASAWAEITCPIPRSSRITRIQVNTSGVQASDPAIVGCVVGTGAYRRNFGGQNRFVYNGSSLGDVSCMLRTGDRVRSLQITVQ